MQHFPIFMDTAHQRIVVSGAGETALAKLRLLIKTEADIEVFGEEPVLGVTALADEGRIHLKSRTLGATDIAGARLVYAANDDEAEDARVADLARQAGGLVNVVDNLGASDFITPAIVDRDPVTVAIGTEGAAPVLARKIKADLEARLPAGLGVLARIGKSFRHAAEALPFGRARRSFWAEYYEDVGPTAFDAGGDAALTPALERLLTRHLAAEATPGHVTFAGAGPGDPELLTLKARRALDGADVVIHDRLVAPEILELARREAKIISVGKEGFGPSTQQADIDALIVAEAASGAKVVRLKGGDPTVFGRLDEEISACDAAGIDWTVIPGITAASAAAASLGQGLTTRGRNGAVRFITGHDAKGFAEHDWSALARSTDVIAIYMGKRTARFIQGRLLMHGANPDLAVSIVENASRPDERVIETRLRDLEPTLTDADLSGPALTFLGLAPRRSALAQPAVVFTPQQEIAQ